MKLSIVIPCYNEAESLPRLFESIGSAIMRDDIEVLLVNNGSTDNTEQVLAELALHYPMVQVVHVSVNKGYGFGVLSGLREARGEYIGWMHGDLQTPFSDALNALRVIEERGNPTNVYVKGLRKGRSLFDEFFTYGMAVFETLLLRTVLYDINAQPNIFHRSFFEQRWLHSPHDFALDLYALYTAKRHGLEIIRIPVQFPKRQFGQSHWNTSIAGKWKFIKRTIVFSFALKKRLARV
mgnify:FL=1